MSGASTSNNTTTTQATTSDSTDKSAPLQPQKPTALEEDDEFEDFPVEDWTKEEEVGAQAGGSTHLWEESWDDDDTTDDFSVQLKEELKKMGKN